MVSHELRAPLTSIKGSTATVLGASPVFGAAEMLQFFRIIDEQADHMSGLIADPAGCRANRQRYAVGCPGACGGGARWWNRRATRS